MSVADVEYRGYFIEVQLDESVDKCWRPKAVVSAYRNGTLHQETVTAPSDLVFDSEDAAVTYSLAMAKKWIDDH